MTSFKPTTRIRRPLIVWVVVAGLLAAPLATLPIPVEAAFPGYNGKIAYQTNQDGNSEIYVINADGSNPTNLTQDTASDTTPTWSADGTKIAFVTNRDGNNDVYIMNPDGSNPTNLTQNSLPQFDPTWSPDGTKIAYKHQIGATFYLFIMNADGSNQTQVAPLSAFGPLRWSPDGTKIAFASNSSGNYEIWTIHIDGTNATNLTNTAGTDYAPDWSPDGTRIIFNSVRSGTAKTYVMNSDDTNQQQLSTSALAEDLAVYSADGTRSVFVEINGGTRMLYVMNADGSNQTSLGVTIGGGNNWPNWQPIPNQPPNTAADTLTVPFNMTGQKAVHANDTDEEALDPANITISIQPSYGTATVSSTDGRVTYTPYDGYVGSDELTYQICDSFILDQKCAAGVLGITVQAPVAPSLSVHKIGEAIFDNGTATYTSTTARPTFSGTATPEAKIKVEINSDAIILTTTTDNQGNWTVTPEQDIPNGEHTVTITATKDGVTTTLDSFVLGIKTGTIPNTGADTGTLRMFGVGLLAAGIGLYLNRRRHRTSRCHPVPPLFR